MVIKKSNLKKAFLMISIFISILSQIPPLYNFFSLLSYVSWIITATLHIIDTGGGKII